MKIDKVTATWALLLISGVFAYNGVVALAFHKPIEAASRLVLSVVFLGAWGLARWLAMREEQKRRNAQGS